MRAEMDSSEAQKGALLNWYGKGHKHNSVPDSDRPQLNLLAAVIEATMKHTKRWRYVSTYKCKCKCELKSNGNGKTTN